MSPESGPEPGRAAIGMNVSGAQASCDCGDEGCEQVLTDCCGDVLRHECETTFWLDSNGDKDVRVCRDGFGCDERVWVVWTPGRPR